MQVSAARSLSVSFVHMVLFAITFLGISNILTNLYEQPLYKKQITTFTPFFFPLLVISKNDKSPDHPNAQIVTYEELDKFLQQNPDYTFLVPTGKEKELQAQLDEYSKQNPDSKNANASFKIIEQSKDRQVIEISEGSDLTVQSWYEASDKSFSPLHYLNKFGNNIHRAMILPSLIIALILYGIAFYIFKLFFLKKQIS